MRRTTICRSSAFLATVLAATALASRVSAQAPPPIQRPIQQAQRAQAQTQAATQAQTQEQQPAAQQPRAPAVQQSNFQRPATHVVQQGETLWALAQQFLGDPLLWPEIYRLNTAVVEDPHWIFPGEELRLAASGEEQAQAAEPQAAEPAAPGGVSVTPTGGEAQAQRQPERAFAPTSGPTIFAAPPAIPHGNEIEREEMRSYRAVREGEYFSSGFLTEGQDLNSGTISANLQTSSLGAISTRTSALQYDEVTIDFPAGETLNDGDMLLSFRRGADVTGFGEVIVPTGMLRVSGQAAQRPKARVTALFQAVRNGQEVIKVSPFSFNSNRRPQPVTSNAIEANVLRMRDNNELAAPQGVLFLDKGAEDGVQLGDVFQIYLPAGRGVDAMDQDQGRVIVVNTRSHSCTGVIIELYRPDISSRSAARQVRRMPS